MKRTLILLMALIMAVMTTYLFYNYTKGLNSKAQGVSGEMVKVVTAKENIPQGTEIIKDMLELTEVPKSTIQPDAAKTINDVAGKVAIVDIKQNEMILSHHVREVDHVRYLAYKIQPGYRAVTITARITGETVANLIEPGDKVDVIFSIDGNSSFLLVNVPVLAVDQGRFFICDGNSARKCPSRILITSAARSMATTS